MGPGRPPISCKTRGGRGKQLAAGGLPEGGAPGTPRRRVSVGAADGMRLAKVVSEKSRPDGRAAGQAFVGSEGTLVPLSARVVRAVPGLCSQAQPLGAFVALIIGVAFSPSARPRLAAAAGDAGTPLASAALCLVPRLGRPPSSP